LALLRQASQAGPALVAATGATTTTTTAAARQLLRGRSPFRGEWEHIPCFPFWRAHALRSKSEEPFQKKETKRIISSTDCNYC
jgi:hypothetical protein